MNFNELAPQIINALNAKANSLCPCCGSQRRTLLPGFIPQGIQDSLKGLILGGKTVPMIGRACINCGYVQHFALKLLLPDAIKDELTKQPK
ncbi:MAG: hypothetical protein WC872_03340 [Candidatus Absconditabacterales bacterium]